MMPNGRGLLWVGRMKERVNNWVRDYDALQQAALLLLYLQIGCALVGSLGASYNGVLVINLAIALFALVAIESSSQSLARIYALLLFSAILLDLSWFFLFSHDIWNISSDKYGVFYIFSIKLTFAMEILGFTLRLSSSFFWIQIYRLGASHIRCTPPPALDVDSDLRTSFLSPPTPAAIPRQPSDSDVVLGGSIYDPAYFSSLFEDSQDSGSLNTNQNSSSSVNPSTSCPAHLKVSLGRSFDAIDEENPADKPESF